MRIRYKQIKAAFPDFSEDYIIIGSQKHLIHFDIILDDRSYNVFKSNSTFPVLMKKPWNADVTGLLSVNNLEDFLQLVHLIKMAMAGIVTEIHTPAIIALVGPSGGGKTEWTNRLIKNAAFVHPVSYTTNPDNNLDHKYISKDEFERMEFVGKKMYGGYGYGTLAEDINGALKCGCSVVMPLDICGAVTMKRKIPTLMVYCKKEKDTLIENILRRNCSINEKKLRLLALEQERKNEALCDLTIQKPDDIKKILNLLC